MVVVDYDVDESVDVNGTCLQGKIKTSYDKLVEKLGKPTYTNADPYEKVNAEWTICAQVLDSWAEDQEDTDYKKVTIYNWKDGFIPTEEYEWHIGGKDYDAVCIAHEIINGG